MTTFSDNVNPRSGYTNPQGIDSLGYSDEGAGYTVGSVVNEYAEEDMGGYPDEDVVPGEDPELDPHGKVALLDAVPDYNEPEDLITPYSFSMSELTWKPSLALSVVYLVAGLGAFAVVGYVFGPKIVDPDEIGPDDAFSTKRTGGRRLNATEKKKKSKAPQKSIEALVKEGNDFMQESKFEEAEESYRQLDTALSSMQGPNGPYRVHSLRFITGALIAQEKWTEAEETCKEIMVVLRKNKAPADQYMPINIMMSEIYVAQDRLKDAEALCQDVLKAVEGVKETEPGEKLGVQVTLLTRLATIRTKQRRYAEAVEVLRRVVTMVKANPEMRSAMEVDLVGSLLDNGSLAEANDLAEKVYASLIANRKGSKEFSTLVALLDSSTKLANKYLERNIWPQAERWCKAVLDQVSTLVPAPGSDTGERAPSPMLKQLLVSQLCNIWCVLREEIADMRAAGKDAADPQVVSKTEEMKAFEERVLQRIKQWKMGAPLSLSRPLRSEVCHFKPSIKSYVWRVGLRRIVPLPPGEQSDSLDVQFHVPLGAILEFSFEDPATPGAPLIIEKTITHSNLAKRNLQLSFPLKAVPANDPVLRCSVIVYSDSSRTKVLGEMHQLARVSEEPNQYSVA
jgi:hypothetical protein